LIRGEGGIHDTAQVSQLLLVGILDPINSKDVLNSILNEEFLSDGDSEEPIEES